MTNLKRLFTALTLILFTSMSIPKLFAQGFGMPADLVEWGTPRVEHLSGDSYRIELSASISEGWKMYDMTQYVDGPNPTTFTFDLPEGVELSGETYTLTPPTVSWDEMFAQDIGSYKDNVIFVQDFVSPNKATVRFSVEWMVCSSSSCVPPDDREFEVTLGGASEVVAASGSTPAPSPSKESSSLWLILLEAVLWGFAALLTPCVFPMVPMTISFFMKGEGSGRLTALLYGLFIVALYTLPIAAIILITYVLGGDAVTADIFNWIATHWLPNILFFIIFMIFAASFFGAFEITLPSSWVNSSDSRAGKGSLAGIFFLALTLVLVSFSCTGPIVGSVLIKSASGEFWRPIITMLAFSTAFALPFVVVALFPTLLKKMPRSGGWLGSVKVVLGFLEIALGLKFLSVADQTYHWGLLSRELYLSIWIVVFSLLGLYLLGKIRFAHDDKVESIGVGRLALAIISFTFVVYITPGLWGQPLPALAGYLPPPSTLTYAAQQSEATTTTDAPRFSALDDAQAYANEEGKPLLVYFTGYGCVNCREMEQRVLSDSRIAKMLRDDFVVASLYMDDKRELPEAEWVTTSSGRVLKNVGRINSNLALSRFGVNAQPYYIPLGRDGELLIEPRSYDLNIDAYIEFLESALREYNR
ncbi:MAG: cytochrome c biogenesis protein CcdA [Rikenellaceae bacterium]